MSQAKPPSAVASAKPTTTSPAVRPASTPPAPKATTPPAATAATPNSPTSQATTQQPATVGRNGTTLSQRESSSNHADTRTRLWQGADGARRVTASATNHVNGTNATVRTARSGSGYNRQTTITNRDGSIDRRINVRDLDVGRRTTSIEYQDGKPALAKVAVKPNDGGAMRRYEVAIDRNGNPNFTPHAEQVNGRPAVFDLANNGRSGAQAGFTGNREVDARAANARLGWNSTPPGLEWHHHENGRTMVLLKKELHGAISHSGGVHAVKSGPK